MSGMMTGGSTAAVDANNEAAFLIVRIVLNAIDIQLQWWQKS